MASNVEIIVSATDKASNTLRGIGGALNGLGALGGIAKAAFVALATAVAGAGVALGYFASAASEAEQSQTRFNALVGSSKLAGFTDEMQKMAAGLSKVTRFEDENILEAEAMISLYQNIGQDIFPQVIETALDLAEVLKTDATGGAETLGRALSDIAEGSLMMLARSRLITKEQQKMAEEMAATGDEAGAQAYILDILNGKIGTLAESMGSTFQGKLTIFKNNIGNIAEALGGPLLEALSPVVESLNDFVTKIAPVLQFAMENVIVPAIGEMVDGFLNFMNRVDLSKIIKTVIELRNLFDSFMNGEINFEDIVAGIGEKLRSIDWGAIRDNILAIDWKDVSTKMIDGINSVDWNAVGLTLGEVIKTVFAVAWDIASETDWVGLFSSLAAAMGEFATGLGGGSRAEFIAVWTANFEQLKTIIFKIIESVRVLTETVIIPAMRKIGANVVEGLKAGILGAWASFVAWFVSKLEQIISAALSALDIHSPSGVFKGMGKQLMAGLSQGIGEGITMPINTIMGTVPQLMGATALAGAPSGATNIHNYYGPRMLLQRGQEGDILATLTE